MFGQLGHEVVVLRKVLPEDASNESVLAFANDHGCLLLTCNRDDFLDLAGHPHHGIFVTIRSRTRAAERASLFRLLERAGESGLKNNINFA